jgi:hypothetical protein
MGSREQACRGGSSRDLVDKILEFTLFVRHDAYVHPAEQADGWCVVVCLSLCFHEMSERGFGKRLYLVCSCLDLGLCDAFGVSHLVGCDVGISFPFRPAVVPLALCCMVAIFHLHQSA